jgi:hypothetical protein
VIGRNLQETGRKLNAPEIVATLSVPVPPSGIHPLDETLCETGESADLNAAVLFKGVADLRRYSFVIKEKKRPLTLRS